LVGSVSTWSFDKNGDPVISNNSYRELRIINSKKVFSDIGV
jgi:hypothetical protein